eukprot:TRINITY_DN821_c0_g1_i3.p1 TRINITY_DN821_c0_g1~~TRINITY_DN821_c0_g1_i3.p1  ORF type:complete len:369 (+),score=55.34 TRINITY_DN821_c0_g1_i3:44-1108(+)
MDMPHAHRLMSSFVLIVLLLQCSEIAGRDCKLEANLCQTVGKSPGAFASSKASPVSASLLQRAAHASGLNDELTGDPRLRIITVTGTSIALRAKAMGDIVRPTMGNDDSIVYVCDPGCDEAINGSLGEIVEMPEEIFPGNKCSVCPERACFVDLECPTLAQVKTSCPVGQLAAECAGKTKAQMKFVWGFIHEVRKAMTASHPMPKWWMIKDDDTFVDADGVMKAAASYDPQDLVALGTRGADLFDPFAKYASFHGGFGVIFSSALAVALATTYRDQWVEEQMKALNQSTPEYDFLLSRLVESIPNVTIDNMNPIVLNNTAHGEYCLDNSTGDVSARCEKVLPYAQWCWQQEDRC